MGGSSPSRSYSHRTLKELWGRAAGRCAVPECRIELIIDPTDYDPMVVIGDIAHIEAASDKGPRGNKGRPEGERDQYGNLILLCKNCHARLDGQKKTNTVEKIQKLKQDHEEWVRKSLPERGKSTTGWTAVILQGHHPIDKEMALAALTPDFSAGDPELIVTDPEKETWELLSSTLAERVDAIFGNLDPFDCRLAIFPLAPVSACITLGYLLTNRPRVRLFQYHRDEQSWSWHADTNADSQIVTSGLPDAPTSDTGEIAICFHVSASIADASVAEVNSALLGAVHVSIPNPSTDWLQEESQLSELARKARVVFESCAGLYPESGNWHLFCAVPAPVAVAIGQQINPTMSPPVQLYEYRRAGEPAYQASVILGEK